MVYRQRLKLHALNIFDTLAESARTQFKVGHFTISSVGVRDVTGVGFTPRLVRITHLPDQSTTVDSVSFGAMDDLGNQFAISSSTSSGSSARSSNNNVAIRVNSSGSNTTVIAATFRSMLTDGFSLNVTTAGASQSFAYEAFR